ncbi:hypothetical protein ACFL5O_00065 [Myxococcota bacterium]
MARQPTAIDRDKLRAAVRKLGHEYVFYMLNDAIDMLPRTKLHQLAQKYLDVESLRPDGKNGAKANLLAAVKTFDQASRAGEYYESFMVNSRNYMEKSTGTTAWISEFGRLLNRCVAEHRKVRPSESREAFDVLFGLLDYIDECHDDVIFFADEGGAWQVGVDWERVLPPWFRALSATAPPSEYAERITTLLRHHCAYESDSLLAVARKIATAEQRKALAGVAERQASQRRGRAKP